MLRLAPRGQLYPGLKENFRHTTGTPKAAVPVSGCIWYEPKCQGWWGDRKCDKMAEAYASQRE